jgi:hypothetical protein
MTRVVTRLVSALALSAAAALVLAACSSGPETTPTEMPQPTAVPSSPGPTPTATETAEASEPTCDTIIPESTVADYAEVGWTSRSEPLRVGSIELDGGITCTWGDYSVATDHVQIYGWAPITETEVDAAIAELVSSGWTREDEADGVYMTESADTAIGTDEEGYGLTYLFGDGWVKFADTKQSLLLVIWPTA